ncbi:MAG: tetratricopeptide repeat protein [Verrucomicrobiales bacterium]|nr:tetratricopeptide repeat protein [Verrucomicrobiales bacterium]
MADRRFLIAAALATLTLFLFWRVQTFDFVNYDDPGYVYDNVHVRTGLSLDNIIWAFTSLHGDMSYWHPLTWLSHQLDSQLFGLNAGAHHLTNVLFHCANSVLLLLLLARMTGHLGRAALVAGLFAWHPLHVESVAWVAERKDVLSTFFWMLAMLAYLRYAERPRPSHYLMTLLLFASGLMSKPIVVTFPFVLLLLDYWPLGRLKCVGSLTPWSMLHFKSPTGVLLEKLPFLALSLIASGATLWAQIDVGAANTLGNLTLSQRLATAVVGYGFYLGKMFWPSGLCALYLHPGSWPFWLVAVEILLLLGISGTVLVLRRQYPYLLTGWLWYVGTLVPMIGLVQVGPQAAADRHGYIPLVGLFLILVWGLADVTQHFKRPVLIRVPCGLGIVGLAICTFFQTQHWKNSEALFRRALAIDPNNEIAHNNLGRALEDRGQIDAAAVHYEAALKNHPFALSPNVNLGQVLLRRGDTNRALYHLAKPLQRNQPELERAHAALAYAFVKLKRIPEAIDHYSKALVLRPNLVMANVNLASILAMSPERQFRDGSRAVVLAQRACELTVYSNPNFLEVLAASYREAGRQSDAAKMSAHAQSLRTQFLPTASYGRKAENVSGEPVNPNSNQEVE